MFKSLLLTLFLLLSISVFAQKENNIEYKVVGGLRIFPFYITDFNGFNEEYVRVNLELGSLISQKTYLSIGYTPISKSIYTFEEFWFIGLDKKNPIAFVAALDYNFEPQNFVYSFGFGFQRGFVNAKILLSSEINIFHPYLKIGVIFPLNWEIYSTEKL